MPMSKLFYNRAKKSALVCDWDAVSGKWKCNGGHPYRRTVTKQLAQLREEMRRDGYEEAPIGLN